jgi:uncharacterized protein YeaO (DUF488 family)
MTRMPATITTRRWDDPAVPGEGTRILVTRYRPRAVARADETWDEWQPDLGPSKELHALVYAKVGEGIPFATYRVRYLQEMRGRKDLVAALAKRVAAGESVALLCSSQCTRESRCHRSILKELIEREVASTSSPPGG